MYMTKIEIASAARALFRHQRDPLRPTAAPVRVRPISEAWSIVDRVPAYKSAVANVAYIWRDDTPADRFGGMPRRFAERRYELHSGGLLLPASAPLWAADEYRIWEEADDVTAATGKATAVAAWHVVMDLPEVVAASRRKALVETFVGRELVAKGAAVAWAIHAVQGDDGWIVPPHAHLVVTARRWRHDYRHGERHPGWIGCWQVQQRFKMAWIRHRAQSLL